MTGTAWSGASATASPARPGTAADIGAPASGATATAGAPASCGCRRGLGGAQGAHRGIGGDPTAGQVRQLPLVPRGPQPQRQHGQGPDRHRPSCKRGAAARLLVRGMQSRRPARSSLSPEHEDISFDAAPSIPPRGDGHLGADARRGSQQVPLKVRRRLPVHGQGVPSAAEEEERGQDYHRGVPRADSPGVPLSQIHLRRWDKSFRLDDVAVVSAVGAGSLRAPTATQSPMSTYCYATSCTSSTRLGCRRAGFRGSSACGRHCPRRPATTSTRPASGSSISSTARHRTPRWAWARI